MFRIDQFSLTAVPVEQWANGKPFASATAFVWQENQKLYLITNRHVVTCRNAQTGKNLYDDARRPDMLRVLFNLRIQDFGKKQVDLNIRDDSDNPIWLIHPAPGRYCDVVAIPLPYDPNDKIINFWPINRLATFPLSTQIGMDVFILGYPFGAPPPGFPVWKRGSIASEPQLVRGGYGYLLIDTASRPGMSGSPVICRSWKDHILEGDIYTVDNSTATKFIGVYSGRYHTKDAEEAQLGMVWPPEDIRDIIAGAKLDE